MITSPPRICCIGRRRIYPQRQGDEVVLELKLERAVADGKFREDHLARLPMTATEARKLHRALGALLKKA